jgi:hypothetical protein
MPLAWSRPVRHPSPLPLRSHRLPTMEPLHRKAHGVPVGSERLGDLLATMSRLRGVGAATGGHERALRRGLRPVEPEARRKRSARLTERGVARSSVETAALSTDASAWRTKRRTGNFFCFWGSAFA